MAKRTRGASDSDGGDEIGEPTPANHRNLKEAWAPGQSGNPKGRPKGSRSKLSEAFLTDFYDDWKAHGTDVIAKVRASKPADYLRVAASLLPRQIEVTNDLYGELSDEQLAVLVAFADSALGVEGEGERPAPNAPGPESVN